jgi:hypothetical protein
MIMWGRLCAATAALAILTAAAEPAGGFDAAKAFGAREWIEQASISPDGSKIAFIHPIAGQGSALEIVPIDKSSPPKIATVVRGTPERLTNCEWVSNDRLVCTIYGVVADAQYLLPFSRAYAVNDDGSNPLLLSTRQNIYSRGIQIGRAHV